MIGTIAADDSFAWVRGDDAGTVTLGSQELAPDIPLLLSHDEHLRIGTVEMVVRARSGVMLVVASVDSPVDRDWYRYLSVGLLARRRTSLVHHDGEIDEVSLVNWPAGIGAIDPVRWHERGVDRGPGGWTLGTSPLDREVLDLAVREHAHRTAWKRRATTRLIVDLQEIDDLAQLRRDREAAAAEAARRAATPRHVLVPGHAPILVMPTGRRGGA